MGNSGSTTNGQFISAESEFAVQLNPSVSFVMPARLPSTPLRFHSQHGDHVDISQDGMVARRIRSYCKGIVFTNRPVEVGEMVCFRVKEQSSKQQQWSGSLRIGLTNHDPEHIADLASALYLCPDLTNQPGFWAKPLPDSCATIDNIIHFQCQENGQIIFGVNGVCKGPAFDSIDTSRPLWAVFDVYGTTVAVELLDASVLERLSDRTVSRNIMMGVKHRTGQMPIHGEPLSSIPPTASSSSHNNFQNCAHPVTKTPTSFSSPSRVSLVQSSSVSRSSAHPPLQVNIAPLAVPSSSRSNVSSGERNTNNVRFRPVHFTHLQLKCLRFNRELTGRNAILTDEGRSARLAAGEFNNGYVFLPRAMMLNETLVMRIEENDWDFDGGLTFGLTTCDPTSLCQGNLPDDADNLLDRSEYWIVAKDVATRPKKGDEFAFTIKKEGAVAISKNNNKASDFLFVDASQTFWMFFELYGTTRKISLLGCCNSSPSSNQSQTQPRNISSSITPTPPEVSALTVNLPRTQNYKTTPPRPPLQSSRSSSDRSVAKPPPRRQSAHSGTAFSDLIDFNVDLPSGSPRADSSSAAQHGRASHPTVAPPAGRVCNAVSGDVRKPHVIDRSNSVPVESSREGECCICFENPINSVVYTCGHQVMCYDCAISHFRNGKVCPICRSQIKDIIKTYRT